MNTIEKVFPNLTHRSGEVAVEVEVEGTSLPVLKTPLWNTTTDNSLKGGKEAYEYVMREPVHISEMLKILKDFEKKFEAACVDKSVYAGIHTHINVQSLSPRELINFISCYIILEDLLVEWCGETRVGNHFCLRTSDAGFILDFIRDIILDENLMVCAGNDDIRYCSINLKALGKYGSVEFRSLNSTIDADRIYTWCKVLTRIKHESMKFVHPGVIIPSLRSDGLRSFVIKMLGEDAHKFLTPAWERSVKDGIIRVQDIVYCKDWDKFNLNIFRTGKGVF